MIDVLGSDDHQLDVNLGAPTTSQSYRRCCIISNSITERNNATFPVGPTSPNQTMIQMPWYLGTRTLMASVTEEGANSLIGKGTYSISEEPGT